MVSCPALSHVSPSRPVARLRSVTLEHGSSSYVRRLPPDVACGLMTLLACSQAKWGRFHVVDAGFGRAQDLRAMSRERPSLLCRTWNPSLRCVICFLTSSVLSSSLSFTARRLRPCTPRLVITRRPPASTTRRPRTRTTRSSSKRPSEL
jgi:hypothetical protein